MNADRASVHIFAMKYKIHEMKNKIKTHESSCKVEVVFDRKGRIENQRYSLITAVALWIEPTELGVFAYLHINRPRQFVVFYCLYLFVDIFNVINIYIYTNNICIFLQLIIFIFVFIWIYMLWCVLLFITICVWGYSLFQCWRCHLKLTSFLWGVFHRRLNAQCLSSQL